MAAVLDTPDDSWVDALLRLDRHLRLAERELHSVRGHYQRLLKAGPPNVSAPAVSRQFSVLTAQECRVALLVADGSSNEQVAAELRVSVHTIKSQLQSIYRKFGIRSRWQLARPIRTAYVTPPRSTHSKSP